MVIKDASINHLNTLEIEEYIKKNDKDIEVKFMLVTSDTLEIKLSKNIKSLFGVILGKESYTITSSKTIDIINEDIPMYQ